MPNTLKVPPHRSCGAPQVHHRLLEDRRYQRNRIEIERYTSQFMLWGAKSDRKSVV